MYIKYIYRAVLTYVFSICNKNEKNYVLLANVYTQKYYAGHDGNNGESEWDKIDMRTIRCTCVCVCLADYDFVVIGGEWGQHGGQTVSYCLMHLDEFFEGGEK